MDERLPGQGQWELPPGRGGCGRLSRVSEWWAWVSLGLGLPPDRFPAPGLARAQRNH